MAVAELVINSVIALVGLYLAYNLRRHQNLKIAEQRIGAYSGLWEIMELAQPTRLKQSGGVRPLSPTEARTLGEHMTAWYYKSGNGMMLTNDTKEMYVNAKDRLVDYSWRSETCDFGEQLIHDLSILRTQMKRDLNIYGALYYSKLTDADREFLHDAGFGEPKTWPPLRWYQRLPGLRPKRRVEARD
jgi:hypothetical protein